MRSAAISAASSTSTASPARSRPTSKFGDAITATVGADSAAQPADPADGPPRHGVSQGRADAPAVQDRGRPRLWAGRLRHEGRAGDELLRAGGAQEVRRRAGAGHGAVHRRRGDRLAVLAAGDRAHARARPRGVQLRAGPRAAARRSPAARAACSCASTITGKAAHSGANFEHGISAINELAHKTLALHALSELDEGHHAQRRRRRPAGRPSTPWRPGRGARSICASSRRPTAPPPWPRSRRSWRRASCPAPAPSSRSPANSCRWSRAPTARRCSSTTPPA